MTSTTPCPAHSSLDREVWQQLQTECSDTISPFLTDDSQSVHLLMQISFLHKEVERLEKQLESARENSVNDHRQTLQQYEEIIEKKNVELRQLQQKVSQKWDGDLHRRCVILEKQLAAAIAEGNTVAMERNDAHARIRKLEGLVKVQKSEANDSKKSAGVLVSTNRDQVDKLTSALRAMANERASLEAEVNSLKTQRRKVTSEAETHTDVLICLDEEVQTTQLSKEDKECQVDSAIHFATTEVQSLNQLYHVLETKSEECDALRARVEDLAAAQDDAVRTIDSTKRRLAEEVELRKLVSADAEKLSIQLRSLQQKNSEYASTERDLVAKLHQLEEQRQKMRVAVNKTEREKQSWDVQLQQYEKDMEQLVANKNFANQQLSLMANENENLRAEVQRLLQREAQLGFSLKAKDGEIQELLSAYQNSIKENENMMSNQQFLERELDNLRATLSSKEDGILYLQEQLHGLHQREQQLVLDLQTFEYENEQLHRRVLKSEAASAQMEARSHDQMQAMNVGNQTIEELHQGLAELSKQVVVKENEAMLLRRRCEALERDMTEVQSLLASETVKSRSLEDANARMTAREVLGSSERMAFLSGKLESLEKDAADLRQERDEMSSKLESTVVSKSELEQELITTKSKLKDSLKSNERLQQIVVDQMNALSLLSK